MKKFACAVVAIALGLGVAAAQPVARDSVREPGPNRFHDRVLSIQVTDTAEGSPTVFVTFENYGITHAGHGMSDGAFAAMSSVILTAIQMDCPVTAYRQAETPGRRRDVSWRLNWVQLEAHDCRTHR